jgi:hypothetical protein
LTQIKAASGSGPFNKARILQLMEALMSAYSSAEALLTYLRERWKARGELTHLGPSELARIAGDLGMTSADLQMLAGRGSDAANLLYERMRLLGLTRDDADRAAHGLMRDLERTCALCNERGVCEKDISTRPDDAGWKDYCPNAIELEDLKRQRERP